MNTSSSPCACPLLADKQLSSDDQKCHVPNTRTLYLHEHLGRPCHDGTKCSVCPQYPEQAAQEVTIRDQLARKKPPTRERAAVGRERAEQVYAAIFRNSGISSASR